jgi:3-deoxy-7-phosphoheptulonate synthase
MAIVGVLLESFLQECRLFLDPTRELTYGHSITDACLGWETTEQTLQSLRDAAIARRG